MKLANIIEDIDVSNRYDPVDTFIHELAKLFGSHDVPEYGAGAVDFPDFIALQTAASN